MRFKDTGHGMSQEARQNLFNPDYTTKSYGTGLGMAIVRRIITVHGGEIAVESEENGPEQRYGLPLTNPHTLPRQHLS